MILIDNGYQDPARYPDGPGYLAKAIKATGARPGLKLELGREANPKLVIQQSIKEGYTYLKLGDLKLPLEKSDAKLTEFEQWRKCYAAVREAAGEETYLLDSPLHYNRAAVGYVDACRTGRTAWRKDVVPAIRDVLRSYYLNGRWFAIDNDHFYLGTDIANVSEIVGGWPVIRTWMSMVGLSCGAAFTSDPLQLDSVKPFWRNLEALTPPAKEESEVLDLATAWIWPRIIGHVRRPWGDATVALLWNPGDKEKSIELNFQRADMGSKQRYAVWSFWENRYLGLAQEFWNSPTLAPSASQHLRFTPIPESTVPVVIGSNLHIYCGAAEIHDVQSRQSHIKIDFTDAGARSGDIFLYSRYLPVLSTQVGLRVTNIDQAGENVWRIRIRDRARGQVQSIALDIMLPVTRQWWFWTMFGVMLLSIGAAVWRYLAWLHLQRQHALAEERSRIARDLHDDLGANLAEIAMFSDLAQEQLDEKDPTRQILNEIFSRAETNARRLGEIVWAINPANDTLERFAGFLCKFAQDFLALARVRCRLEMPQQLPQVTLNSLQRHNLFLAAKEVIHNAVRHGKPNEIHLQLTLNGAIILIKITDDGCGFDASLLGSSARGLRNLRERMDKIGGTVTCQSAPGEGTVCIISAPLSL